VTGKRRRKKPSVPIFPLVIAVLVVAAMAGYGLWKTKGKAVPEKVVKPAGREAVREQKPDDAVRRDDRGNRVALIIDDLGYDLDVARKISNLPVPIALAVLPHCPFSREVTRLAREKNREILLHLPMEPRGYPEVDPGEGALLCSMTEEDVIRQLEKNIEAVPGAVGVNNHMGSLFMENGDDLEVVLCHLKRKSLFFIDSLTTGNSRAGQAARRVGLPFAARDVFIDNGNSLAETRAVFERLLEKRSSWRELVLIGHPYETTVDALEEWAPKYEQAGIRFVPLSSVVKREP